MKTAARIAMLFAVVCLFAFDTDNAEAGRRRRVIRKSNGQYSIIVQPDTASDRLPRFTPGVQQQNFNPATTRDKASTTLHWGWLHR